MTQLPLKTSVRAKTWRRLLWPLTATIASVAVLFGYQFALDAISPSEFRSDADRVIRLLAGASSYFSAAWLASRLVSSALDMNGNGSRRAPKLLYELVGAGLFIAALLATIVFAFDGSVLGAAATSGVLIAVVGFALRNVVADIFAGIALSLERSYRIGDSRSARGRAAG